MEEQHLSKFDLMRLLEKDTETRTRVAEIGGGGGSVEVDNRSIEKSTGTTQKLKVKNGKTIHITDGGIEVSTIPTSGIGVVNTGSTTGIYVKTDNETLFVDEDDNKVKVKVDESEGLTVGSDGIGVNYDGVTIGKASTTDALKVITGAGLQYGDGVEVKVDDDTIHVNGADELEVKVDLDGGLSVGTDGIKIETGGTPNVGKFLTVATGGNTVEWTSVTPGSVVWTTTYAEKNSSYISNSYTKLHKSSNLVIVNFQFQVTTTVPSGATLYKNLPLPDYDSSYQINATGIITGGSGHSYRVRMANSSGSIPTNIVPDGNDMEAGWYNGFLMYTTAV